MEAIAIKAKKTKKGSYTFSLPDIDLQELDVIVVSPIKKIAKKKKATIEDFFGKLEWKGDPLAYQKQIRNEWN
jgi:hypothetical protein